MGKLANGVGKPVPITLPRNMVYPALLPLMRTPRLLLVDWTDAPADLNGLVRFAERRNLISGRVPSHFNWPLVIPLPMFRVNLSVPSSRVLEKGNYQHSLRNNNPEERTSHLLRSDSINPLSAELNPICHLLALLGAHHILHFSRIRVKSQRFNKSFPNSFSLHGQHNTEWRAICFPRGMGWKGLF